VDPSPSQLGKKPADPIIWTVPRSFVFRLANVLIALVDLLLAWAYVRGQRSASGQDGRSAGRLTGLFLKPRDGFEHTRMQRFEVTMLLFVTFLISAGFLGVGLVTLLPPAAVTRGLPGMEAILTTLFGAVTLVMLGLMWHALLALTSLRARRRLVVSVAGTLLTALVLFLVAAARFAALRTGGAAGPLVTHLMFFTERARNLDSGVSVLWIAVLIGVGHALWILGHLRQVRIIEDAVDLRRFGVIPADPRVRGPSLLDAMGLGQPMRAAILETEGVWPTPFGFLLMAGIIGDALWISRRLVFFERSFLGIFCALGYAILLALIVYACARYLRTWRALEEVLAKVAPRNLTTALERIPAELLTSFKRPWDAYVFDAWQHHCQKVLAPLRKNPALRSRAATALGMDDAVLDELLVVPVPVQMEQATSPADAPAPGSKQARRLWEDFMAMRLVAYVHYVRTHLANFVAVSTAALLSALWATNFYPLKENRFLLMLVLAVSAAVVSVAAVVSLQMNRNYVLGKIYRQSNAGHTSWDGSLVTSLLVHVALPLLALLAVKFPELGHGWSAIIAALSSARTGGS
jgi:hypothetical protein